MGKKKDKTKKRNKVSPAVAFLTSDAAYETLCCSEYVRLDRCPEILTACRWIAELISTMTIHLMSNTSVGDERIINELSRQVDITPNRFMTRKTWMDAIIMNLLLYGSGNSVVIPKTTGGVLGDMIPVDPYTVSFIPDGYGYYLKIGGVRYEPDDVLHFVLNPDPHYPWKGQGLTAAIKEVANNLKQAQATKKGFMESKWKPSIIVKVDAMTEEFSGREGRRKLLDDYMSTSEAGEPWLIPAEQFSIEQVKPLTLADLAIRDSVELDKATVASIIGVPLFLLGVGSFNADEWNNFISNRIRPIAKGVEQELTRKLLISPKWYWRFNVSSLYSYDIQKIEQIYADMYTKGLVDGNTVRDKMSLPPRDGLDKLVILENFIPLDKVGDQNKLGGGNDADV